jgi:hypothetical protein
LLLIANRVVKAVRPAQVLQRAWMLALWASVAKGVLVAMAEEAGVGTTVVAEDAIQVEVAVRAT